MKIIEWTQYARNQCTLRFARYDISIDEIEVELEKQEVKFYQGYDNKHRTQKFKTIFRVRDIPATVEKAEIENRIRVITLWESSEKEIELWKQKK